MRYTFYGFKLSFAEYFSMKKSEENISRRVLRLTHQPPLVLFAYCDRSAHTVLIIVRGSRRKKMKSASKGWWSHWLNQSHWDWRATTTEIPRCVFRHTHEKPFDASFFCSLYFYIFRQRNWIKAKLTKITQCHYCSAMSYVWPQEIAITKSRRCTAWRDDENQKKKHWFDGLNSVSARARSHRPHATSEIRLVPILNYIARVSLIGRKRIV